METKHSNKNDSKILIFSLGVLLLVIAAILIIKPFNKKVAEQNAPLKVKSTQSATIISSSSTVVVDDTSIVDNTGDPEWVKVNSKGGGNRFTDLSTEEMTIYKAHSPQVLKTLTSTHPSLQVLSDVMAKYPDALIMNASGFNMETGNITGFQINNGKLLTNWGENKRAYEAFVINKDGSLTTYDSTTPADEVLTNGAAQSYSFGKILIKDGVVAEDDGSVDWMIHSFIGNDENNNIYVMISKTSTGYDKIMATVADFKLTNFVLMDGGGSSQMGLQGQIILPSQDDREVGDYIVLN
ncbi:hypothetical protein Hs30E_09000 [Lactococcus hodotermopsidis]|uniref:Phosphodiester glycosidase domain-containing protein n=1 Tax=Pseudolactococcus hodotermopsidis TaxID=2709157 RepID=A0A6A0BAA2_9LACT|nr:phosphodiester glycosidase family protein [Lactococcus hodotermopsidis]GFH42349.1 hypothetical protein Hs30E_09000 [Lactococcus hodotermopsidis]